MFEADELDSAIELASRTSERRAMGAPSRFAPSPPTGSPLRKGRGMPHDRFVVGGGLVLTR